MKIPRPIEKLINHFERLPGIGPKTAQRLVFNLFHYPQEELEKFAEALINLKKQTNLCSICKNIGDTDPCWVCADPKRDNNKIAVVSSPLDVFALEKAGFKGVYHVLHGIIDPLNNIGPDEIFIADLINRLNSFDDIYDSKELILATNTSMEGESTALYITKLLKEENISETQLVITRLARGLPAGGDVEYADATTLGRALEGRVKY